MTRLNKVCLTIVIICSSLFVMRAYFINSFPYTHDGENHLARFANYKLALKEGQFPPRLAPNLLNRYGYPVFNYNYPLANILSLPFSALKIEYELTFKILVFISLIVGGVGVYQLTTKFFTRSTLGLYVFVLFVWYSQTYHQNLLLFRGTIGEIMAVALLPHVLNVIFLVKNKYNVTHFIYAYAVTTSFLLSHNITVLFGGIILPVLAVYILKKDREAWQRLILYVTPSLGSVFWFWFPALMEKNLVTLDSVDLFSNVPLHLLSWNQILFDPLGFGYSLEGPVDSLGFSLGFITILIMLLASLLVFLNYRKKVTLRFFLFVSFFLVFLQTFQSEIIWKTIPIISYIQFPWRLSLFLSVTLIPVSAIVWQMASKNLKRFLALAMIITICSLNKLEPVDYFHKTTIDYDAFTQSTSTQNENLPKTFTYTDIADWQPTATILDGDGKIDVQYWTGSQREYTVTATSTVTVVEPTAQFLGWETTMMKNDSADSQSSLITYINNEEIKGRISYILESGRYRIKSKFTQNTWPRMVGNTVSLLSMSSVIAYLVLQTETSSRLLKSKLKVQPKNSEKLTSLKK